MTHYKGIDVFKLIMAFAVIAIHVPYTVYPYQPSSPLLFNCFIQLAVPFYFVISGYLVIKKVFCFSDRDEQAAFLLKRSIKLFRIFACWLLIYLPLSIISYWQNHIPFDTAIYRYFSLVLFKGESLCANPLWFIYSMAIVYAILSFAIKKSIRLRWVFLFFFTIRFINWLDLPELKFIHIITGRPLGGGILIMGGMWLYSTRILHARSLLWGAAFLVLDIITVYYKINFYHFFGGLGIALIALNCNPSFHIDYDRIRSESMWIYYTHMYVLVMMMGAMNYCQISLGFWQGYAIACILSFALAFILTRLQNIGPFRHLRFLIS